MSNISILMVPGANCPPDLYEPTAQALKSKGQDANVIGTLTVAPRTGAPDGPLPTMYDDAAAIAKAVEKLADAGKDVILISHSYGGTPTTQSTKDLSKAERQAAGKPGGVVRLAYMTALVPAIGQATGALMADLPEESKLTPTIDVRPQDMTYKHQLTLTGTWVGELRRRHCCMREGCHLRSSRC